MLITVEKTMLITVDKVHKVGEQVDKQLVKS